MMSRWAYLIIAIVPPLFCWFGLQLLNLAIGAEYSTVTISRIVDGDTIVGLNNGVETKYRLAGIDTPESYNNTKVKNDSRSCGVNRVIMTHMGLNAKEYLQDNYPPGTMIDVEVLGVGRYRRGIIWVPGMNEEIVLGGYGVYEDYSNLTKDMRKVLSENENKAIENKLGIWRYLTTKCM